MAGRLARARRKPARALAIALALLTSCSRVTRERHPGTRPVACISRCNNARILPVCPPELSREVGPRIADLSEHASAWDGKRVTVEGRLLKAPALWTEINCTCCSEQIDAYVAIQDPNDHGALELRGVARVGGAEVKLSCRAREGEMVETRVSNTPSAPPFSFEPHARLATDLPSKLPHAYCCSISVQAQLVIASGILRAPSPESDHVRLLDPSLCEVPLQP